MAPGHTKESLESLPRSELQKLCKQYGVKANLKTEQMISLLLEAIPPQASRTPPPKQAAAPVPVKQRAASIRSSARSSQKRVGSMIIHGDEEEQEEAAEDEPAQEPEQAQPAADVPPPLRTQKAKAQLRLGVGRPQIAGGSGARAVTKSVSLAKGKRGKSSKSLKAVEETIPEEDDGAVPDNELVQPTAGPSNTQDESEQQTVVSSPVAQVTRVEFQRLTDQLGVVLGDVDLLKNQVQTLLSDVARLNARAAGQKAKEDAEIEAAEALEEDALRIRHEEAEEAATREAARMQQDGGIARPTTPTPVSRRSQSPTKGLGSSIRGSSLTPAKASGSGEGSRARSQNPSTRPVSSRGSMPPPSLERHPGIAASTLGKHQRDAVGEMSGLVEEGEEESYTQAELASKVVVPSQKRPKLSETSDGKRKAKTPQHDPHSFTVVPSAPLDEEDEEGRPSAPRAQTFQVFSEPDPSEAYADPAPPTARLPDYFGAPSPPPELYPNLAGTSSSHSSENQPRYETQFGGFNFGATPQYLPASTSTSSFPYMDPPQSPSPAQLGVIDRSGGGGPTPFQGFGVRAGPSTTFVNPAMLTRTGEQPPLTSNDVAAGMGLHREDGQQARAPVGAVQRTMYGTELEADNRFGDFGVEGVASGFWAGGVRF